MRKLLDRARHRLALLTEKLAIYVANKLLPRRVVYWCAVRVWAYATTGLWSYEDSSKITAGEALKRFGAVQPYRLIDADSMLPVWNLTLQQCDCGHEQVSITHKDAPPRLECAGCGQMASRIVSVLTGPGYMREMQSEYDKLRDLR